MATTSRTQRFTHWHAMRAAESFRLAVADVVREIEIVGALRGVRAKYVPGVEVMTWPLPELDMFDEVVGCLLHRRLERLVHEDRLMAFRAGAPATPQARYLLRHVREQVPLIVTVARDAATWKKWCTARAT